MQRVLLNYKPTSWESQDRKLQVYQIAIIEWTSCDLQANRLQVYYSTSFDLRANKFPTCKSTICEVNLSKIRYSTLKSNPSIFWILFSKILHIVTFLPNIYFSVDTCKSGSNHLEVLHGNSCSKYFGKYSGKHSR